MGEKRNWNDDFYVTSMRRERDPGHKFCDDDIGLKLENAGFKLIKRTDFDIVYNFAYVKGEYFDKWLLKD